MTNEACTAATTTRPLSTTDIPLPAPLLISVAEVMLGTAVTSSASLPRFGALRRLRTVFLQTRGVRRSHPARRGDYLESAAMAREMHRL
jgi:hypothetical protein